MPGDTKKRKITDGKSVRSSGSKRASDLEKALRNCDAPTLVHALADTLPNTPPETLHILETVLLPLIQADTAPKHCVRCHKSYDEDSNTNKSCVILCTKPKETSIRDDEYDFEHKFRFSCCRRLVSYDEALGGDWEPGYDKCFTGKHTTDPTRVQYYSRDEKYKETGIDFSGRN
ncbi:hypothetical protein FRC07_013925, partial [Ceratobasidium sp. 392]